MSISHFRFKDIAECERNVAPFYFVLSNKGKKIEGTCKFILPFLFAKQWMHRCSTLCLCELLESSKPCGVVSEFACFHIA